MLDDKKPSALGRLFSRLGRKTLVPEKSPEIVEKESDGQIRARAMFAEATKFEQEKNYSDAFSKALDAADEADLNGSFQTEIVNKIFELEPKAKPMEPKQYDMCCHQLEMLMNRRTNPPPAPNPGGMKIRTSPPKPR